MSLTPLQIWQGFIDGSVKPIEMISSVIPMTFLIVEKGYIKVTATAEDRHLLPSGWAHGGYCATIIDTITAGVVHTGLDANQFASTTDLNVKMIKAVPPGLALFAEATLVSQTRQLGTAEARVTDADGNLYAWGTATCMIRERRQPRQS